MTAHLSSEQFSEYIIGIPSPAVTRHVQVCPACRAELARFREALSEFRDGVRAWSADQAQVAASIPASRSHTRSNAAHQFAWAVAIALVCIIASFVFPRHIVDGARAGDAALLNRVDAQVSRAAPASMEPLMKLVVENE